MFRNLLFEKLRDGKTVLGLCNMYPASGIIEGMCKNWDFVWVDGQHGEMGYQDVLHAVQAATAIGVDAMIRVPGHEHGVLGRYADLCPSAIMVPMVNTAEEAEHVVRGLRFPPRGVRSYGGRRVIDLGGREYFKEQRLLVVLQIETPEGASNAPAIAAIEGVDALFFGPDDMKLRMGMPINAPLDSPEILSAMRVTAEAAARAGKICACVVPQPKPFAAAASMGYRMIVGGGDSAFLREAASARLAELRGVLERTANVARPTEGGGAY